METEIILALDYPDAQSAIAMAESIDPKDCRVKVGKELFMASGPSIIERLHELGFEVFLDLKFHDIPNTVAAACSQAAKLGVWMINVHALGGEKMISDAKNAIMQQNASTILTAVTILTSHNQASLQAIGLQQSIEKNVESLACLAEKAGADGVVCSGQEVAKLRSVCGEDFLYVTPGIRPEWSQNDDQKRVMTPKEAKASGVHYIVVGRPITRAESPQAALEKIKAELGFIHF